MHTSSLLRSGTMYSPETDSRIQILIAHIPHLLDHDFASNKFCETPTQFWVRMKKVEAHLNFDAFAASGGMGLGGLAGELRQRCEELIKRKRRRLPK